MIDGFSWLSHSFESRARILRVLRIQRIHGISAIPVNSSQLFRGPDECAIVWWPQLPHTHITPFPTASTPSTPSPRTTIVAYLYSHIAAIFNSIDLQIYAAHNAIDVENGPHGGSILARLPAECSHSAQWAGGFARGAACPSRPAAPAVAAAQEPIGRLPISKYLCALRNAESQT